MRTEVGIVVDSFVLSGAEVTERRMQPAGVVPALDVLEDRASKSSSGRPRTRLDEFALDGGKKRLGDRVVPAFALATDQEDDAVGPGQLGEVATRVLTPPTLS